MKRYAVRRCALRVAVLLQLGLLMAPSFAGQEPRPRKIAVFGSSVAFGTGDETNKEGYTGLLRQLLSPRGWEVFNQSRGGDTTKSAATRFTPEGAPAPNVRYLTTVNPSYVVIALALTNEGILEAQATAEKEAIFKQYADGLRGFIDRARQNNIVPIVALVYPRMSYTLVEYEYARRMNLLINSWDVPSVNLMGALDDGTGRYVIGFDSDDRHPNAAGHRELSYSIVPSLFEAHKDLVIYRSALNADEAAAVASGTLLQASLELYTPLLDTENRAQSLSVLKVESGRVTHLAR